MQQKGLLAGELLFFISIIIITFADVKMMLVLNSCGQESEL